MCEDDTNELFKAAGLILIMFYLLSAVFIVEFDELFFEFHEKGEGEVFFLSGEGGAETTWSII